MHDVLTELHNWPNTRNVLFLSSMLQDISSIQRLYA